MKKDKINKIAVIIILLLVIGLFLGTAIHEIVGHGFPVILSGGKITKLCLVFFELNENSNGLSSCINEHGSFGWISWSLENQTPFQYGFVLLMGSVTTLIVSSIFSFVLLLRRLEGYKKIIASVFSLYFLDIILNFIKLGFGMNGDFTDLAARFNLPLWPLFIVTVLGAFVATMVLFHQIKGRKINEKEKRIAIVLVITTMVLLFMYLAYSVILFK